MKSKLFIEQSQQNQQKLKEGVFSFRYWKGSSDHVLIYLHGVQSHSGWFFDSGVELAMRGFSIYAPDRRGSGISGFPKGEIQNYRQYLKDLYDFIDYVQSNEKGKKTHLVCLCWGARLGIPVCAENRRKIESLILLAPALVPKIDYTFFQKFKIALSFLTGSGQKFSLPLKDDFFTSNPRYLKFIREDSLGLRRVSARFLFETVKINRLAVKSISKCQLPVLLLLSGKDKIVDTSRTLALFQNRIKAPFDYKVYPDWSHTLEFEEEARQYYNDLSEWILNRKLPS